MIRRGANVVAVCLGLLALACVATIAVSYVRPTTVKLEKVEWDLREEVRTFDTYAGLDRGRLTYFADPRDGDRETLKQDDWTFAQLTTPMAHLVHSARLPVPGPPPSVRFHTVVGFPGQTSILLVWPLIGCVVLAIAARVLARRIGARVPRKLAGSWTARTTVAGATASAALLIAAIVFCVRSIPYFERFDLAVPFVAGPQAIQVNSSRGSVSVAWTSAGPARTLASGGLLYVRSTIPPDRGPLYKAMELKGDHEQALGFTLGTDGGSGLPRNVLVVPYAFVLIVLAAATFGLARIAIRLRARDREAARERCPACGYDCRGLADRCPECGTPIATPAVAIQSV